MNKSKEIFNMFFHYRENSEKEDNEDNNKTLQIDCSNIPNGCSLFHGTIAQRYPKYFIYRIDIERRQSDG
jgi:hypothetical protein